MKRKFKSFMGLKPFRIVNDEKDREEAIRKNLPVRFEIKQDPSKAFESSLWEEIRTFDLAGKNAVREHDHRILKNAEKHNIDPDLVRAVMFAENARGWYGHVMEALDRSKSILPMNIKKDKWSPLVGKRPEDMFDPDINIEAGTVLLKRIADRVDKSTPEKVASIWHYMGRENTDEFGEYVGKVYREKPWKK